MSGPRFLAIRKWRDVFSSGLFRYMRCGSYGYAAPEIMMSKGRKDSGVLRVWLGITCKMQLCRAMCQGYQAFFTLDLISPWDTRWRSTCTHTGSCCTCSQAAEKRLCETLRSCLSRWYFWMRKQVTGRTLDMFFFNQVWCQRQGVLFALAMLLWKGVEKWGRRTASLQRRMDNCHWDPPDVLFQWDRRCWNEFPRLHHMLHLWLATYHYMSLHLTVSH